MKPLVIIRPLKKHEIAIITFISFILLFYVGEVWSDNGNCSKRNPTVDCLQKGTIDISKITPYNFTQTTGWGTHYITTMTNNGKKIISPVPEFRGKVNTNIYGNFMHVVCDLGNSTCEWHLDKYPALSYSPFDIILHVSDSLNFYVGIFTEDVWMAILWGFIVLIFAITVREILHHR